MHSSTSPVPYTSPVLLPVCHKAHLHYFESQQCWCENTCQPAEAESRLPASLTSLAGKFALAKFSLQRIGESRGRADQGGVDWACESGGIDLWQVGHILRPLMSKPALHQPARMCISNFAVEGPGCPIGHMF